MWLKYFHKEAAGAGSIEWIETHDVAATVEDLESTYAHSDLYRGVTYEVVEHPPRWVVERALKAEGRRIRAANAAIARLVDLLPHTQPCPQCTAPGAAGDTDNVACPTCGRWVAVSQLVSWLLPDDSAIVFLLKILAADAIAETIPFDVVSGDVVFARLVQRRLVTGTATGPGSRTVYKLTERGRAEAILHRKRAFIEFVGGRTGA